MTTKRDWYCTLRIKIIQTHIQQIKQKMSTITKHKTHNPTTTIIHCIQQQSHFILIYQVPNCKSWYYLYYIQMIYIVF